MNVLVIGSGGREHCIIKTLRQTSPQIEKLYALPGNGGIAEDAICIDIKATDIDKIVEFAYFNEIDYAIVAPDDPLVMGLVDALNNHGIDCFGPKKDAAVIEGSKIFSKNLMKKYNIPTAEYMVFNNPVEAKEYLKKQSFPIVVKADGLALGKGVIIAENYDEAENAVDGMMSGEKFGESGKRVVIEEFLTGPEVSILAFTDGNVVRPMVSSMDHKRAHDGDTGLNTGGMGTIAPNPFYTDDLAEICMKTIFVPTIEAMKSEGRPFSGCLYFGLMLTPKGPRVIEYNCRFGDPETQVVLPLFRGNLLDVMMSCTDGKLDKAEFSFENKTACCVIAASDGYPESYKKGYEIKLPQNHNNVYIAGAKLTDDKLLTNGGRVLGVTETAETLNKAIEKAYKQIKEISFDNMYYRNDIGKKALQ